METRRKVGTPRSPEHMRPFKSNTDIWWSNLNSLAISLRKRSQEVRKRRKKLTLRTNNKTPSLPGALVDSLDDVDQLLLVLKDPVQLVVVTGPEIAHDVLIPEEEHDRHWVEELVHCVELWDFVDVTEIDHREVWGQLAEDPSGHGVFEWLLAYSLLGRQA